PARRGDAASPRREEAAEVRRPAHGRSGGGRRSLRRASRRPRRARRHRRSARGSAHRPGARVSEPVRETYGDFTSIVGEKPAWVIGGFPLPDGSFWEYREPDAV